MSAGFLRPQRHRRRIRRRLMRARRFYTVWVEGFWNWHPAVLMLIVAFVVSGIVIGTVEERLRPVLLIAAKMQAQNAVTEVVEASILSELDRQSPSYDELVTVERAQSGSITAISTDMAAMNRLRSTIVDSLLQAMEGLDEEAVDIPLGSLFESELMWGRGPTIKVRSFTVGTVTAEFESEFTSAGVNQTLHKIWLAVHIPTAILLPGNQMEVAVDTKLCVAETVIVGSVPSYIQRAYG